MIKLDKSSSPKSIINRSFDFWCLGGLSLLVWLVLIISQNFRQTHPLIDLGFKFAILMFSVLTFMVNQPHFIASYVFAYRRQNKEFITTHWISLIFVPLFLTLFFLTAFIWFPFCGVPFLSLAVLVLNITIGWHYSKQAYGCMMTYSNYDNYLLSIFQKRVIRFNLLSIAFLNFFFNDSIYAKMSDLSRTFLNVPLIQLHLPEILISTSKFVSIITSLSVIVFVFYSKYNLKTKLPSWNFIIPWVAFHIWWVPFFRQDEFYFVMIPFFHSLQYLPFAYRRESLILATTKKQSFWRSIKFRLFIWIFVGFLVFQLIPGLLDLNFQIGRSFNITFFLVSIGVFINIHHYFIDSVIWRLSDQNVRKTLL